MKYNKKRLGSYLLAVIFLLSSFTNYSYALTLDGTQSSWATSELIQAYDYGLTDAGSMKQFQLSITREEFCTIVVKLYEKISNKTATFSTDPFSDTDNPEILKAFALDIVRGKSATIFEPKSKITRQELCVMVYRTLKASQEDLTLTNTNFPMTDSGLIASWANQEVRFCYSKEIMKGTSATTINPLGNTKREEAIILLKRTYEKYMDDGSLGSLTLQSGPSPITDETTKWQAMEPELSSLFTQLDERSTIFVSNSSFRPGVIPTSYESPFDQGYLLASNPILVTPNDLVQFSVVGTKYQEGSFSTFIDKNASSKRWFALSVKNASDLNKIVYQVSTNPFDGKAEGWKSPFGLVSSTELSASTREFQIDFTSLKSTQTFSVKTNEIQRDHIVYYVRAVLLDKSGNPIGDPGKGISVIYGIQHVETDVKTVIHSDFELWTPNNYIGSYSGEFLDKPKYTTTSYFNPKDNSVNRLFHLHGLSSGATQIVIQVSTSPFSTVGGGYTQTENLIYENTYNRPTTTYKDLNPNLDTTYPDSVLVPFGSFGEPVANLQEDQYIQYYVRGIALYPSDQAGNIKALYSQPITVSYGYSKPLTLIYDSPYEHYQEIKRSIPKITLSSYTPMKLQNPEYYQHYVVYRKPLTSEINCTWVNSNNQALYPYSGPYIQIYQTMGIDSAAEYQTQILDPFLPVGTQVYFPKPTEEDEPWYEELYNGVVNFFNDLINIISTIVNDVKAAYDTLKNGLINSVALLCPAEYRAQFKAALKILVESGMVAMGLPPELPNFNELLSGNLEYLASVALTEAGVPTNLITDALVSEMAGAIATEMTNATNKPAPNPINSPFLKLDPAYAYRPAYIDVKVDNPTGNYTVPGSFDLSVTFEFDYYDIVNGANGLSLVSDSNYAAQSDAGVYTGTQYGNHFKYGLNGDTVNYSQGGVAIYDVFTPIIGQKLPILAPYTDQIIRIYLTPYDQGPFSRYPDGDGIYSLDFYNMYYVNGGKKMTYFKVNGDFLTPLELLNSEGFLTTNPETTLYFYDEQGSPSDSKQRVVNGAWTY